MPRRNKRSDTERRYANDVLGDDYKFTRDDQLAEVRRAARKQRAAESAERSREMAKAVEGIKARREVITAALERRWADEDAEHREMLKADQVEGQIYFVRTNGLIKVGWSSNLHNRLRTYGPAADLLCHYPGYRRDETTLHRQLKPCRAKGREWYVDGDIIAKYVEEAVAKHGPPVVKVQWTESKEVVAHTIMRR